MQKIDLPQDWQLRAVGRTDRVPENVTNREISAIVPGCVYLDLMRADLIPDPYLDVNEALVQWIGRTDWEYTATFTVAASAMQEERVDLRCEGLDTIATIWINDALVGQSDNMHVERRFAVKEHLCAGENTIRIRFDSAVYWARENMAKLGELPHASSFSNAEPFHFIRKNACNFGWDWGPGLTTAGVWKPIRLEAWSVARIKSVKPLVKVANEKVAIVDVEVELEWALIKELEEEADVFLTARMALQHEYRDASALYWQLNDCWPVTSWAAIDGDGQPKPLYYATKRFFRDRLLTIQPDGESLALWAHNDSDATWVDTCDVWLEALQGESWENNSLMFNFSVPPRGLMRVGTLDKLSPRNFQNDFLRANAHECDDYWFFDADKNLHYPEPKWTTEIDGSVLRLTAQTWLRDLTINVDRFGGTIKENCVTLLPGETWEIEISGADLSNVDFGGRPIVQCANWYGAQ